MGNTKFSVEVAALPSGEDAAGVQRVVVSLAAVGPEGEVVADGQLEVKLDLAAAVGSVLAQTLLAAAGIEKLEHPRAGRRAANQGLPWSAEMDAELERRWVAGDGFPALAEHFGRSEGSIRARLPRVGCDPEKGGAYLPEPPSRRVS